MRRLFLVLAALLAIGFCSAVPRLAVADRVAIDLRVVYGDLAPYGHWVDRRPYGWVWVPHGVPVYWRPYTYGHWVYTDEYGWLWESDWAWGWAPFHYGRWVYDDYYGWIWVPGTEWAPAWVAWRYGDGWVGWAPLPPIAGWSGGGFSVQITYIERYIRPTSWIFVGQRDFLRPHVHRYAAVPARGVTLLPRTANVTRYERVQNRIVNHSINLQRIERATGKPIVRYRARDVETLRARQQAPRQPRQVDLYRPQVRQAPRGVRPPQPPARQTVNPRQLQQLRTQEEAQRRQLQQHQNTERRRIEQLYQRQRQRTPAAPAVQQLRQREQQELRTLQQEHSRQERLLQRRNQRELQQRAPSERRGTQRPQQRRAPSERRAAPRQQQQAPQDERRRRDREQR